MLCSVICAIWFEAMRGANVPVLEFEIWIDVVM